VENIKDKFNIHLAILVLSIVALILAGFVAYQYKLLNNELKAVENELMAAKEENLTLLARLETANKDNLNLSKLSSYQQTIIDSFQGQIQAIGSTVGTLEKLAQTDPELLKKYSKIFFLSENYVPAKLAQIDNDYVFEGGNNFLIHAEVWPFLKRLLDDARRNDIELLVASAFRSFDTQASLKVGYTVTYGSGANQFSADQGYSEHQLGTSVDFTIPANGAMFSKFESDPAYSWLVENAHKYGFTLSYPKGNAYYKFEPWHWRFVGVALATHLHNENKYFYDLVQREIDVYLIKLFD